VRLPTRITTERLVLRCWEVGDGPALKAAVESSLEELRPWMDWAAAEPSTLEVVEARIATNREKFSNGEDFTFGIWDASETSVVGSSGLHTRIGPDALEIGYWIRSDLTRRGFATETARALTRAAFEDAGVARVEIRCDPYNVASAAVPRRLGYRLREVLSQNTTRPDGSPRDTMVWEITPGEFFSE
jgi:RimJ/RimL family protein N-acetyltransferase